MQAALFQSADTPLVIEAVADPAPLPAQLVLKVARAGICGSDLHMKQYGIPPAGTVSGHEFAGRLWR